MMNWKTPSKWEQWVANARPDQLKERLKGYLASAGHNLAYAALLLYHSYRKPDTPGWAKRVVVGSFAYLLAPIDALPDLTPFIGFTDDLGFLMFGLVSIAGHVDATVRDKARKEMTKWFGLTDFSTLRKVDEKI